MVGLARLSGDTSQYSTSSRPPLVEEFVNNVKAFASKGLFHGI